MGDLGKFIVAKGFKKLPKVQNIAQSGHTDPSPTLPTYVIKYTLEHQNKAEREIF